MSDILLPYEKPVLKGTLIRRYKRFLADVALDGSGETVTVHVPNSGSMLSCSESGREVLVSDSRNPDRKLRLSLELVRVADGAYGWAGVNTALPNVLVSRAIEAGAVPELTGYENLRREVTVEKGTRLDIVLESSRGRCFVEVKNVTLARNGIAYFPDAVTERGRKHLEVLARLRKKSVRAVIFFLVQRPDCNSFSPADDIDPEYGKTLRKVLAQGVELLAYRSRLSIEGAELAGAVPFAAGDLGEAE